MCVPTWQAGRDSNLAVSGTLAQVGATPAARVPSTETPSWLCFTRRLRPDPRIWKSKTQEATREGSVPKHIPSLGKEPPKQLVRPEANEELTVRVTREKNAGFH